MNEFIRTRRWIMFLGALTLSWGTVLLFLSYADAQSSPGSSSRVVYPKRTELDFEGLQIEGEVRNPGEFYFRRRPEEKFDSLVKRRTQFHREMLRDAVLSK